MAECKKWKDFPGFIDPLFVVQYCVSLLSRDVFPNMEWNKFDIECSKAKLKEPCDGIQIYLQALPDDPDICREVRYYITHPCKDEMVRVINKSSRRALQFMLEYLKLRGALIQWNTDGSSSSLGSLTKVRCIIRYANCYMESLPELDYCACVCLGKYLHYVLSVSYAHELFFMKDLLSKLYGPIFIEIFVKSNDLRHLITPEKALDYSIYIFKHMLESCPWNQLSPTETLKRTIYPSNRREFIHKYTELADHINHAYSLPNNYQSNMAELKYRERIQCPSPHITVGIDRSPDPCYRPETCTFPPDKCRIDFGPSATDPAKVPA